MLDELATYAPAVLAAARETFESATNDLDFVRLGEEAFGREPQISIDFAVMERTARAGVLPVSFPWSDIGTWGALWEVLPRDGDGNALRGRVTVRDTRNSLMHSSWMAALSDLPVGEDLRQEILRSPTHVLYVLRRGEAGPIVGAVLHGKPSEALPAFTPTARSATVPPVVPERGVTTR